MIEATERQARALALRRDGLKWREIAAALGMTERNVRIAANVALLKERRPDLIGQLLDRAWESATRTGKLEDWLSSLATAKEEESS